MDWKPEYSIGLREIDEQHKELIYLFSRVTEGIGKTMGWSDVHYRIVELKAFASFHFEFEEALMRMYGFDGYEDHAEFHKRFFIKLAEFEKTSIVEDAQKEMVDFLTHWLFAHILKDDKAYADFLLSGATVVRS